MYFTAIKEKLGKKYWLIESMQACLAGKGGVGRESEVQLGKKYWLIESMQACLAGKGGVGRESEVLGAPSKHSVV